jgi:hypothetical protein
MKITIKLAALAMLIGGARCVQADQTNVVQELSIRLTGIRQGVAVTNRNVVSTEFVSLRIGTDEVIASLGASTGATFSRASKLLVITPLGGNPARIVVRDGSTVVDVTPFFIHEQVSQSVSTGRLNTKTGRSDSTQYSIQRFGLVDSAERPALSLHFDVRGVSLDSLLQVPGQIDRTDLDAYVSGAGDTDGNAVILEGRIHVRDQRIEIIPGNPDANV